MNLPDQEQYNQLSYYTLAHPDPAFIHQHIVDAYHAQAAGEDTKPISLCFALVGLYLYIEKNYSGRQVQQAHMQLAKDKKEWPSFGLPEQRGSVTISDVLHAPPGKGRDEMIRQWCVSVWQAYHGDHEKVIDLVRARLRI